MIDIVKRFPFTFTVCTYNIFNNEYWSKRKEPMRHFLRSHFPDILCLQEFHPEPRELIDQVLVEHERVDDSFPGWSVGNNIYWNTSLFDKSESGAEDIEVLETHKNRYLAWVRLRFRASPEQSLLVATAHLTWDGNEIESKGGANPRYQETIRVVKALKSLAGEEEPTLFMGDLNDDNHPVLILKKAGFCDSFSALLRNTEVTHPSMSFEVGMPPQSLDWIFHKGPLKPMTSEVVDFFKEGVPPSDHKPVLATYRLLE